MTGESLDRIFNKKALVLCRLGEIALKGLNRYKFENLIVSNIKRRLSKIGSFNVKKSESRIWIIPEENIGSVELDRALEVAVSVFGIVSASKVIRYEALSDLSSILRASVDYASETIFPKEGRSFKVESRRGDKSLPYPAPELVKDVGAALLDSFPELKVDVHKPDFVLFLELRDALYIYHEKISGLKGLPIGSSAKSLLLLSGGIDSPVAGFKIASRGSELEALYFHSPPYTSERAKLKVIDLAARLSDFTGRITLHTVNFTDIQLEINDNCPLDMHTIVLRRMMMRIADALADQRGLPVLVTGESLGQVASQTTEALCCTDSVVKRPVFRPLIAEDKDEIIETARRIGTYETSILPFEDCCTVFVPKHPRTRPSIAQAEKAESKLDVEKLVKKGLDNIESLKLP